MLYFTVWSDAKFRSMLIKCLRKGNQWHDRVKYLLINFGSLTGSTFQVSSFQTHEVSPQRPF